MFAASFFWSSLIRVSTPLVLFPKTLLKMSPIPPIPVEPDPTPKATKPTAKTSARRTNIHFACRRRREKKSWSSQLCAFFFGLGGGCRRFRCACAAPRAIGFLGYLRFRDLHGVPVEGFANLAKVSLLVVAAERTLGA